ncbi:Transcriptional regulator MntR (plasmid) [Labrenzia sp. THAF191b]|uniref:Transcriptional regulator MntR n=1 Tax=Roseibium alexandrii (strain DSM 17067 / NCIMB 14079 / DFL-11) TaxID=244592 RepID=A0A5E8H5U9_ROSAD|nr:MULTISPECIES: manganese-binding transcriptional regulator MntR [Stappiaceae]EEE48164.2 Mn-dependent transcriptional regulator [Roseibium alexandrii DFL-11]QFT02045.1 Transcriptional regulator MntR [Labrenzia sp. THAF191b]QFT08329.1 Transcriptional regulator MntR [Labrenzia sp. THAF191a]QFT19891.1 Transcriptional regulator MntR [Labrenzia sp. THAF187b]QFT71287.1 Transcriptional regulator MntR [Labrenzia sp. THAF35]
MTGPSPKVSDRSVDEQASGFEAVRTAHQSEMVEDYVELIAELIHLNGSARPVEIAERLGVAQPTVSKNLARLKREGLILKERYRDIRLTEAGRQLAEACRKRHRIVVDFLVTLGISAEVAEQDAEGIEHHVSEETLKVFQDFVKRNAPGTD